MSDSTVRKPLSATERGASLCQLLVTGGTGFIGSRVVARLLAVGHHVRVACLPADLEVEDATAHLRALPGASEQLSLVPMDVLDAAAVQRAAEGCAAIVHLVALVDFKTKSPEHKQRILDVAVKGAENVCAAASSHVSVCKVVMTSSFVATVFDNWEHGRGHVLTEADWARPPNEAYYVRSKVEQERAAMRAQEQQTDTRPSRWQLVTILPGMVLGPPSAKAHLDHYCFQSTEFVYSGKTWPFGLKYGLLYVDVDDVAAALCEAMVREEAQGRYLVATPETTESSYTSAVVYRLFPHLWRPLVTLPRFLLPLLFWLQGKKGIIDPVYAVNANKDLHVDVSRMQRELGITPLPLEATLRDMLQPMIEAGRLPAPRRMRADQELQPLKKQQ